MRCPVEHVAVVLIALLAAAGCASDRVYWTDARSGTVESVDRDGNRERLVEGLRSPRAVLVDPLNRKLFYADPAKRGSDAHAQVEQSDLDGSNRTAVYRTNNTFAVEGLALDSALGRLYFAQNGLASGPGEIWTARVEPPFEATRFVTENLVDPRDLAVDAVTHRIYWADSGTHSISSIDRDGADRVELVSGLPAPYGVAIDPVRRRIYWTDTQARHIAWCNVDQCVPEILVAELGHPIMIELDLVGGYAYWTEMKRGQIMRVALEGGGPPEVVESNLGEPSGLALGLK